MKMVYDLLRGYLDAEKFKTDEGLASYIRESIFGDSARTGKERSSREVIQQWDFHAREIQFIIILKSKSVLLK